MDDARDEAYLCEVCQTGYQQPRTVTLVQWWGGEFITVPNFPAWVCDVCGAREYAEDALEHLQAVLGPQAALRQGHPRPRRGSAPARAVQRGAGRHFV